MVTIVLLAVPIPQHLEKTNIVEVQRSKRRKRNDRATIGYAKEVREKLNESHLVWRR